METSAPKLTDFYAEDSESASRGVLIYQNLPQMMSDRLSRDLCMDRPSSKGCIRFPQDVIVPRKPEDPLYVFSKWSLIFRDCSVVDISNMIIDSVETSFTKQCEVSTKLPKCKITIQTPCGLVIKVKFFQLDQNDSFMVMFKKDAGDWFAFSSFFTTCTNLIESRGISFARYQH